jgi:L-rhamnose isomerase/sugar isomerase
LLVNYSLLEKSQDSNDAIQSMQILKTAYNTDVSSIIAMARFENGNSIDPINTYRKLDYKKNKSLTRKNEGGSFSGIV